MARRKNSNGVVIGSVVLLLFLGIGAKNAGLLQPQNKQQQIQHEETGKEEVASSVKEAVGDPGKEADKNSGGAPKPMKRQNLGSLIEPMAEQEYKPTPNESSVSQQWYDKSTMLGSKK
jgi:hypothetical protein